MTAYGWVRLLAPCAVVGWSTPASAQRTEGTFTGAIKDSTGFTSQPVRW